MDKVYVNGPNTHPVYKFLRTATDNKGIDWNFAKFLVDREGDVKHYPSSFYPKDVEEDIKGMLGSTPSPAAEEPASSL